MLKKFLRRLKYFLSNYSFYMSKLLSLLNLRKTLKKRVFDLESINKNETIFLLPQYMTRNYRYDTSFEIVTQYKEFQRRSDSGLNYRIFFYDGKDIQELLNITQQLNSNLVYLYGPNIDFALSESELIDLSKKFFGSKILILTDGQHVNHFRYMMNVEKYFDIILLIDTKPKFYKNGKVIGPILTPNSRKTVEQIPKINFNRRNYDVGIFGTLYDDRKEILDYSKSLGLNIYHFGGTYDKERLTSDEYFIAMANTKIQLVTLKSQGLGSNVLRGHFTEALVSNNLIFADTSFPIPKFFKSGESYVVYKNKFDFVDKAKYYLSNLDISEQIANNAHRIWAEQLNGANIFDSEYLCKMKECN